MKLARKTDLKLEFQTQPHCSWFDRSRRNQKVAQARRCEINVLGSEAEDGRVQRVESFNLKFQLAAFGDLESARRAQVQRVTLWAAPGVARQIASGSDCRQREGVGQRLAERRFQLAPEA